MAKIIEASGNKVDDLSFVHGVGMAQGVTSQDFTFIDLELMGNTFLVLQSKTEKLIEADTVDAQLREIAVVTQNFKVLSTEQASEVTKLFANLFYQTELFHPALAETNVVKVVEGIVSFVKKEEMPSEEMIKPYKDIMDEFQKKSDAKDLEKSKVVGDAGYAFLAENAKKKGVKVTESGLQYEIIKGGEGVCPNMNNEVTVHYEGSSIEGNVFDSSYEREEEISFELKQVITGWVEGLQLMNSGSKYKFYIPQQLAYGDKGAGSAVAPFEALIFTIELISFK
jgi:FKBP-type peptidyl-prolyl cis-trans isomerase FklB